MEEKEQNLDDARGVDACVDELFSQIENYKRKNEEASNTRAAKEGSTIEELFIRMRNIRSWVKDKI